MSQKYGPNAIVGWREIVHFTLVGPQVLTRWMKLYGFPQPNKIREGRSNLYIWDKTQVLIWLATHEELVDSSLDRVNCRSVRSRKNINNINERGLCDGRKIS